MIQASSLGSAPAKLILIGEHFVVPWTDPQGLDHLGSAALALPLPALVTEVRIAESPTGLSVYTPDLGGNLEGPERTRVVQLMKEATEQVALRLGVELEGRPISVSSTSNFPISRGLGSSASFAVALVRALLKFSSPSQSLTEQTLFTVCQEVENLFHGRSSGLDTAVILRNCLILYKNGAIQSVFHSCSVDFVIVDSGPRDGCSSLVTQTIELRRQDPEGWHRLSSEVDQLAQRCFQALQEPKGAEEVGKCVQRAHEILGGIGLITPHVERILATGLALGALSGKISGAGGGGAVFFVVRKGQGSKLCLRLEEAGIAVLKGSTRSSQ